LLIHFGASPFYEL